MLRRSPLSTSKVRGRPAIEVQGPLPEVPERGIQVPAVVQDPAEAEGRPIVVDLVAAVRAEDDSLPDALTGHRALGRPSGLLGLPRRCPLSPRTP